MYMYELHNHDIIYREFRGELSGLEVMSVALPENRLVLRGGYYMYMYYCKKFNFKFSFLDLELLWEME